MAKEPAAKNDRDFHELVAHGPLFELYEQMLGDVNITEVLRQTTTVVRTLFAADRATTYLVRQDTQELESAVIIGNVSRRIRVPICADSLAGYCALTGKSFVIPDAYGDLSGIDPQLSFDRSWDELNQYRTRDVMCAPALFKDEVMGVVQVINSKSGAFQDADLISLQSATRFVAYALYHARLYDELATLKGLEKEKAEFMRILVHELKSPVTASKMLAASLLRYGNIQNEQVASALDRIQKRMVELLDLVQDILHLSKIKSGNPLGEIVVCDLAAETHAGCERYYDEAKNKGLAMVVNLPQSPVAVRIDLQGYSLILSNLVSNAIKYTPAGSVTIGLRQADPWAVLEIQDTGMGIPKDEIPKLFTEFFRATNARRSKIEGTGVGLAGVKELVERFGGELEMASQEGEGSVFTARLPLYAEGLLD